MRERGKALRAQDIMTRPVVSVGPGFPVGDAVALLAEHAFAALPVVDHDNRVLGLFTETDALAGIRTGDPGLRVRTVMTAPVDPIDLEADLAAIAVRMLADRIRSVPVTDRGELAGIVSRRDLLAPLVRRDDAIASRLRTLLSDYAGHRNHWEVSVAGGAVTIRGTFSDEAERRLVKALALTAEGVVAVELSPSR
ncbi:CBS domain-containing protein [Amycolatopsis halotolerans]|uniref:CBS domain-containing protein n=1 Tax=Amycolatopsis halotolerans TaxID=330083 RepID=A0ABV7QUM9_9PSEU